MLWLLGAEGHQDGKLASCLEKFKGKKLPLAAEGGGSGTVSTAVLPTSCASTSVRQVCFPVARVDITEGPWTRPPWKGLTQDICPPEQCTHQKLGAEWGVINGQLGKHLPVPRDGEVGGLDGAGDGGTHRSALERKSKPLGICHSGALVPDYSHWSHAFLSLSLPSFSPVYPDTAQWVGKEARKSRWRNSKKPAMPLMGFWASVRPTLEDEVKLWY